MNEITTLLCMRFSVNNIVKSSSSKMGGFKTIAGRFGDSAMSNIAFHNAKGSVEGCGT